MAVDIWLVGRGVFPGWRGGAPARVRFLRETRGLYLQWWEAQASAKVMPASMAKVVARFAAWRAQEATLGGALPRCRVLFA